MPPLAPASPAFPALLLLLANDRVPVRVPAPRPVAVPAGHAGYDEATPQ
jgi:hypothetical protein